MLLGVLVPTTALALPMYLLASEIGVVNTYWAVLIPVLVNPFGVYLSRVFCSQATSPTRPWRRPGSTGRANCASSGPSACAW